MWCKSNSCSCSVSTASTGFQLMMRHVCMVSLYLLSSVHTGGPSSKALTRINVMQKQFLQLCCFHSVHRGSAHDAACLYGTCLYGIAVYVEQLPHWGTEFKTCTRLDVMPKQILCNCAISTVSTGFQLMMQGLSSKAFTRTDAMCVACCVSLLRNTRYDTLPRPCSSLQLREGHLFLR